MCSRKQRAGTGRPVCSNAPLAQAAFLSSTQILRKFLLCFLAPDGVFLVQDGVFVRSASISQVCLLYRLGHVLFCEAAGKEVNPL